MTEAFRQVFQEADLRTVTVEDVRKDQVHVEGYEYVNEHGTRVHVGAYIRSHAKLIRKLLAGDTVRLPDGRKARLDKDGKIEVTTGKKSLISGKPKHKRVEDRKLTHEDQKKQENKEISDRLAREDAQRKREFEQAERYRNSPEGKAHEKRMRELRDTPSNRVLQSNDWQSVKDELENTARDATSYEHKEGSTHGIEFTYIEDDDVYDIGGKVLDPVDAATYIFYRITKPGDPRYEDAQKIAEQKGWKKK